MPSTDFGGHITRRHLPQRDRLSRITRMSEKGRPVLRRIDSFFCLGMREGVTIALRMKRWLALVVVGTVNDCSGAFLDRVR